MWSRFKNDDGRFAIRSLVIIHHELGCCIVVFFRALNWRQAIENWKRIEDERRKIQRFHGIWIYFIIMLKLFICSLSFLNDGTCRRRIKRIPMIIPMRTPMMNMIDSRLMNSGYTQFSPKIYVMIWKFENLNLLVIHDIFQTVFSLFSSSQLCKRRSLNI